MLRVSENQGVLTVALNRPDKRNAFNPEMIRELSRTFLKTQKDKNLRAVILTGEGASFCSGGDLEWMKSMARFSLRDNVKDASELYNMYWNMRSCPVPVIGRVFGHCFGGGAGLTAVCDIVGAETSTQFCFSEVKWGLVPAVISPFVMEKVPAMRAREWFMTAKVFGAKEAAAGGLVHTLGSLPEVDFYIEETVKLIQASGPSAVRDTKKLLNVYSPIEWKKMKPMVTKLIATRRVSAEGQFGLKAFLEKQSPQWSQLGTSKKN